VCVGHKKPNTEASPALPARQTPHADHVYVNVQGRKPAGPGVPRGKHQGFKRHRTWAHKARVHKRDNRTHHRLHSRDSTDNAQNTLPIWIPPNERLEGKDLRDRRLCTWPPCFDLDRTQTATTSPILTTFRNTHKKPSSFKGMRRCTTEWL